MVESVKTVVCDEVHVKDMVSDKKEKKKLSDFTAESMIFQKLPDYLKFALSTSKGAASLLIAIAFGNHTCKNFQQLRRSTRRNR